MKGMQMNPNIPVNNCCGCTACYSKCPKNAIEMKADVEGFLFPKVNESICVQCGLCETVCPLLNKPSLYNGYVDSFVAQHTDRDVLKECTSGGFVDALCEYVLNERQGYVAGVVYDLEFMPVHRIVDTYEEAKKFRNSKYAQSNLSNTFQQIRNLLESKEIVLFVGTPCQVAGLKTFLTKEYENLYTIDLVCRSIPSPRLWKEYLVWQKKRYNSDIRWVSCRKKTYGYHSGALEIGFENGKRYAGSNRVDYFMKAFHGDMCSRLSCYDCKFKTQHRCSDFTVFDSWNPQLVTKEKLIDDDRGFSNVLVHSTKGKKLINCIQNIRTLSAEPMRMFEFTGGMESQSIIKPDNRECFYNDLEIYGFLKTMKKHVHVTLIDRMIEYAKPFRYFIKQKCCSDE